jgi:hypothetical protein
MFSRACSAAAVQFASFALCSSSHEDGAGKFENGRSVDKLRRRHMTQMIRRSPNTALFGAMLLNLVLCACGEAVEQTTPPADLKALVRIRMEHGLRLVEPEWMLLHNDGIHVVWGYPQSKGAGHAKQVKMQHGVPSWEEDYYYTGRSFPSSDGDATSFEQLTLHYDYGTKLCGIRLVTDDPALFRKVSDEAEEKGLPLKDALSLRHAILSAWSLKR